MRINIIVLLITLGNAFAFSQTCDTAQVITRLILSKSTDSELAIEPRHHVYINPDCDQRGLLLVHLPGTGDNPASTTRFPKVAANNGFHAVVLKYKNNNGSAFTACNESSNPDCYINFRKEILEGTNYSADVEVDVTNSIYNRLAKLIIYLDDTYPTENWGQYIVNDTIQWDKIILSGHSQGGGHAPVAAIEHRVHRVLMFAAPNDKSTFFDSSADWANATKATPDSCFYGLMHKDDNSIGKGATQYDMWNNLGMDTFGDTVNVDEALPPYSHTRKLTTSADANWELGLGPHSVMLVDRYTPIDNDGIPVFEAAWKYMLGVDVLVGLNKATIVKRATRYPNPIHNSINIEASNLEKVVLYSANGTIQMQNELNSASSKHRINVDFLEPGLYLLQLIYSDGLAEYKKFVR